MGTGSPGLSKLLSAKPGAGQNIAVHASPAVMTSAVLMSTFWVYSTSFLVTPFQCSVTCNVSRDSEFLLVV